MWSDKQKHECISVCVLAPIHSLPPFLLSLLLLFFPLFSPSLYYSSSLPIFSIISPPLFSFCLIFLFSFVFAFPRWCKPLVSRGKASDLLFVSISEAGPGPWHKRTQVGPGVGQGPNGLRSVLDRVHGPNGLRWVLEWGRAKSGLKWGHLEWNST